jgi:adenylosuccinate lyase
MRNLQRSEIGEVGEPFGEEQVGSSTMPQKRNPENFENVESLWKEFVPRMTTKYLDQVSEHQRDLTNSASQRYDAEFFMAFDSCVRRILSISKRLVVDRTGMKKNLDTALPTIVAEPLYILLASVGHPNAHEYIRKLTLESPRKGKSISDLALSDPSIQPLIGKLKAKQLELLRDPAKYLGLASSVTDRVLTYWENRLREENLL